MSETNTNTNPNDTNNNQNSNQSQNNHNNNNNNDAWLENLKKNEEQRKKDSKFFNMQPGEKAVLEFLPEFGPVWKDFDDDKIAETLRYEYKVIDVNNRQKGPIPWDVSKRWSAAIDYYLKEGHRILKVQRVGSGNNTMYYFTPVVAGASASVSTATA